MPERQLPLFDLPGGRPVPRARTPKPGTGPVTYANYTAKQRRQCDDCSDYVYQQLMAGHATGHLIAQARFTREQAGEKRWLCAPHRRQREDDEAAPSQRRSTS